MQAKHVQKGDRVRTKYTTIEVVADVVIVPADDVVYLMFAGHTESYGLTEQVRTVGAKREAPVPGVADPEPEDIIALALIGEGEELDDDVMEQARGVVRSLQAANMLAPATVDIEVDKTQALRAAMRLVNESSWFAVTPLPFDRYRIDVKRDRADALRG